MGIPENGDVERVGRDGGGETDEAVGRSGKSWAVSAIWATSAMYSAALNARAHLRDPVAPDKAAYFDVPHARS